MTPMADSKSGHTTLAHGRQGISAHHGMFRESGVRIICKYRAESSFVFSLAPVSGERAGSFRGRFFVSVDFIDTSIRPLSPYGQNIQSCQARL
jgi:hypothetical protein